MKKLLILSTVVTFCSPNYVFAKDTVDSDTKIKLEGFFQFQSGFRSQNNLEEDEKNVSGSRKGFAFYTDAVITGTVTKTIDDITYGGKLVLIPSTKLKTSMGYNGSHIFVESGFGKIEVGSPHDAAAKMRITGDDVGCTGSWFRYSNLEPKNVKYFKGASTIGVAPEFADCPDYFFDSVFKTKLEQVHDNAEPTRKISYFTPKISGLQFGVSYIPDSSNVGGASYNADPSKSKSGIINVIIDPDQTWVINTNVKDAFSVGAVYEYEISDEVSMQFAATGEYGKASNKIKLIKDKGKPTETKLAEHKLSNLKTYNVGAILTYGKFSYGVSYGTLGNSLTSKEYHIVGRNTSYYNGAIAYSFDKITTNISYFKSNRFKNTLEAIAIGAEYQALPGLVPYAEIAYFKAKGRPVYYPEAPKKEVKGTVAILGVKLKF